MLVNSVFDVFIFDRAVAFIHCKTASGASIISMLVNYLGKTFFDGVYFYLKKYSYKNADTDDLLRAISEQDENKHPNLLVCQVVLFNLDDIYQYVVAFCMHDAKKSVRRCCTNGKILLLQVLSLLRTSKHALID